ncbi:MAG: 2-amino-4-hydroxy-6-hydroxymethyldihydropteridine diphosphokinase [Clostridia bacterium]|nr:2-amino-4-hydroxy-6-hydroxymethyldihydropteridine diphosphokinase [Clostridia bacterium]MDE7329016.1 2-amino-4-hydroxy-6-hydroxymethyldihydropteridine diphosphokinase [Clostridia bacterium]
MTKIKITGLEVLATHGVFSQEKVHPQPFVFDCEIDYDFKKAAANDDFSLTLDYGVIMQKLTDFCKANSFDLIETLCYRAAATLMNEYPAIESLTLSVHKPKAPVDLPFKNVSVEVTLKRQKNVYLSLGSNLGDRQAILNEAISQLGKTSAIDVLKVSSPYENPPYGLVAKFPFINMAAQISTYLSPDELLEYVHSIEKAAHRNRDIRWGDRTLDIDIIFYGDLIATDENLTIPHADFQNRDFVLIPLNEIAPDFVSPINNKRISQLLKDLSKN